MKAIGQYPAKTRRTSVAMAAAILGGLLLQPAIIAQQKTDVTFAFTADTHISYNGTNDDTALLGIATDSTNPNLALFMALRQNETMVSLDAPYTSYNGCTLNGSWSQPRYKTLCNQVQLVRKLNALTSTAAAPGGGAAYRNSWPAHTWCQNGKFRRFASAGRPFSSLQGVIVGGDLTDCAGGSIGECSPKYDGARHAQTYAFQALFDRTAGSDYRSKIASASFLRGLRQIGDDIPLHYALYPELGNHDLSHFDINDGSSKLVDYVKSWNPDASGDHKVTNRDSDSGAYSMDWGNLHVIVVGVSPGASGHEYRYSESSMDWFRKDLATYAYDGRPVVIAQHFGFDTSWSLTSEFWEGSDRIEGFIGLWPAIKDYNVIGFFTGHDHSVGKPYKFPDWNTFANSMGYDVFRPGAGYSQQFAAIRVTDHSMDVAYTRQRDYDSSGNVALASDEFGLFTKKLVPGPKITTDLPQLIDPALPPVQAAAMSTFGGNTYLLTVDANRGYKVRRADGRGFPATLVQTGVMTGSVPNLRSYRVETQGETRILATTPQGTAAYRMSEPNGYPSTTKLEMQKLWEVSFIRGDLVMPFETWNSFYYENGSKGNNYLLVEDAGSSTVSIYRLGQQGPVFAASRTLSSSLTGTTDVPFTYKAANGKRYPGFLRYAKDLQLTDGTTANVEFYGINDDDANNLTISLLGSEQWPAGGTPVPIRMNDGSTQIMVKTAFVQATVPVYTSSPYVVRAVLDDGTGTDLAWRGRVGLPFNLVDFVHLGFSKDGKTQLGVVGDVGLYARYSMEP